MPRAMATAALRQVSAASCQRTSALARAGVQPLDHSKPCAASATVIRMAEAATASMPVLISGLSIKVATDWHSAASRPSATPMARAPRVCSQ